MRVAPGAATLVGPGLLAAAAVVLAGALLRGGGSQPGPLFWIGSLAVLAAATGLVLRRLPLGPAERVLLAALGGLAGWSAISVVWSIEPDRSWDFFNRAAIYASVVALGMLVGATPRVAGRLLAALFGVTVAWALFTVVVPALGPDVERSARLREPVEYWNALALVAAMALPVWLSLRRPPAAPAIFGTVVALVLTTSRGGVLVAVVAVALWLWLVRPRREAAWLLLLSAPPGIAVGGWALTTAVAEAGTRGDTRAGILLGAVLVVVGAGVFALARLPAPAWAPRATAWIALAGLLAAVALAVPRLDDAWDEFRNPPSVQVRTDPGRLAELSSNHRWTWWTQAWTIFRAHPLGGAGAGTYELARRPLREDTLGPIDPHNLPLKALAETGIVGLLLLSAAVAAAVAVVVGALRRTTGEDRVAAAALAAGGGAWLLQSLVDMPWEYAAATVPLMFGLGVLGGAGLPVVDRAPAGRLAVAVPGAAAFALLASLAFPWLAERRLSESLDALTAGDGRTALAAAQDARALNPLSVQPLSLEAVAYEVQKRPDAARSAYERAVRLQPENPDTWYELGRFEYEQRNLARALLYLDRSWGLDRQSPETGPLLDRVREELSRRRG